MLPIKLYDIFTSTFLQKLRRSVSIPSMNPSNVGNNNVSVLINHAIIGI